VPESPVIATPGLMVPAAPPRISVIGIVAVAALLWWENSLVKPDDLSRVNLAFFDVNGYISVLIFIAAWAGLAAAL